MDFCGILVWWPIFDSKGEAEAGAEALFPLLLRYLVLDHHHKTEKFYTFKLPTLVSYTQHLEES